MWMDYTLCNIFITIQNGIGRRAVLHYAREGPCYYAMPCMLMCLWVKCFQAGIYLIFICSKNVRARANVVKCKILNVGEGPMSGHRKQRKTDKLKFIKI